VRNRAVGKYNRAIEGISKYMKYHIDGARVEIVGHVLAISSLGSFDYNAKIELRMLLNTKVKSVINIWAKRLIVAAIKGSYNIWLKR
jgi:intracellular sulfur oxidation DsrE/DsrF family protein